MTEQEKFLDILKAINEAAETRKCSIRVTTLKLIKPILGYTAHYEQVERDPKKEKTYHLPRSNYEYIYWDDCDGLEGKFTKPDYSSFDLDNDRQYIIDTILATV